MVKEQVASEASTKSRLEQGRAGEDLALEHLLHKMGLKLPRLRAGLREVQLPLGKEGNL